VWSPNHTDAFADPSMRLAPRSVPARVPVLTSGAQVGACDVGATPMSMTPSVDEAELFDVENPTRYLRRGRAQPNQ
jgi:hypothetical protein